MTNRERFLNLMEYGCVDRVPNWEIGVWAQTIDVWKEQGAPVENITWYWLEKCDYFNLDQREYITVNYDMIPPYEEKIIEKTERWEIIQHSNGIVTKALVEGSVGGARMSMDQYLRFPVESAEDFRELKKRYIAAAPERYLKDWRNNIERWRNRDEVLVLGHNCAADGFYWRAREWMGTENLSYAWYDMPDLMHEMMEFFADFTIETSRPILEEIDIDYFVINEDMAMKNGPLMSPDLYKKFIYPHAKRLIEFFKSKGTKYIALDCDGNPEPLIPLWMDAGVDVVWPLERASDMDPVRLRKKFGKSLRLWGGVDKREIAKGKSQIDAHLKELSSIVEDGGFVPTIDHSVPPDISWDNFVYYMDQKRKLLEGKL